MAAEGGSDCISDSTPYNIVQIGNDFCSSVYVPQLFMGFIIGKKGLTRKQIESDTGAIITVPFREIDDVVKVRSDSRLSVEKALLEITSLIEVACKKIKFTHFLSIPANLMAVKESFLLFKDSVLKNCSLDCGIEESVFQNEYKLHLTLCIVLLVNNQEVEGMLDVVKEFQNNNVLLFNSPLSIHIRGLESMNSDLQETYVLYGKVVADDSRDRLQLIADKMVDFLLDKNIIKKREYDKVILHMTLMNASFKRKNSLAFSKARKGSNSFDCSNIMQKYSDWDFGVVDVEEIQLSQKSVYDSNGFYQSAGSFKFG